MKTNSTSRSAFLIPRAVLGFALCSIGLLLALAGWGQSVTGMVAITAPAQTHGTWQATGRLGNARFLHTATLLPNGQVLVAGGGAICDFCDPLASAELYDPVSGMWTVTGRLATKRREHTATLLPNGKVLVAGGYNGDVLSSAQLYDSATGLWTATGSMATARYSHSATLLPNGTVLVAGGVGGDVSAELYDPATGLWTATGSMATAKDIHTATLLPNGQVLVAGGYSFDGDALAEAELYDPATGLWTATDSMATARYWHTATLLPDGHVLVAAGFNGGGDVASAELYTPGIVTNGCLPPPAGLVSWWSGDRTADDVQGINPGTLLNGASFAKGMVGPAFEFDGVDDGVGIPNSPSLSIPRLTVDAWIYQTGNENTNRRIIGKDDGFHREYSVGIVVTNTVQGFVNVPSFTSVTGTTTIQLNNWYHIAMTYDGLKLRLYVNGLQEGEVDAVGDIIPTPAPFVIGSDFGRDEPFKGKIDEGQVFNRALTDAEIMAIYEAGPQGQCKPEIFVASIDPSFQTRGHEFLISTSVTIQDVNGVGIEDARARIETTFPDGQVLTFPVTTDQTGKGTLTLSTTTTGLYTFKVRKVTHPTREYDAALNIETSDTLLIP